MYAVEKLSSYITRGVYTVSGPFHPFGGAVDIIVVQQEDGSFKSSPWYVRFGKFQGVLKTKEKVVNICVNGVEAGFHMYLDHKGEAYFLKEAEAEEGDFIVSPPSSGDETDKFKKTQSCNINDGQRELVDQTDMSNGKMVARTNSKRSRIFGLMFGGRSMKENVARASSLERAEIAADLLEMKWSTNLPTNSKSLDEPSDRCGMEATVSDGEGSPQIPSSPEDFNRDQMTTSCVEGTDDSFRPGIVSKEHFEDVAMCTSSSLGADEVGLEITTSDTGNLTDKINLTYGQTTIGINQSSSKLNESILQKPVGDSSTHGLDMVSEVLLKEKIAHTVCLRTHEEILQNCTRGDDLAIRSEIISELLTADSNTHDISSDGSFLDESTFNGESPCRAASGDLEQQLNERGGVSINISDVGNGEEEEATSLSYCQILETSDVKFNVSVGKTQEALNLSSGSGEQIEHQCEDLCERSYLIPEGKPQSEPVAISDKENLDGCHHQDLKAPTLEDSSGSGNPQADWPSNGASEDKTTNVFCCDSPTILGAEETLTGHSFPSKVSLINSESVNTYQQREAAELSQVRETSLEPMELCESQYQMNEGDSSAKLPMSRFVEAFYSSEKSELESICSFSESIKSNDKPNVGEKFEVKNSCLSSGVDLPHKVGVATRPLETRKVSVPSLERPEDDHLLFNYIDSFGANEVDPEQTLKDSTVVIEDHPLLLGESDGEEHEMKYVNDDQSFESFSEVSKAQTSPIPIPRSRAHLAEPELLIRSLPIIRSHIHDLERSDLRHPISCSLNLKSEKNELDLMEKKIYGSSRLEADSKSNLTQDHCFSDTAGTSIDAENWGERKVAPVGPPVELSLCKHLLFEGMGAEAASQAFHSERVNLEKYSALGPSIVKNERLVAKIGDCYFPWVAAAPIILGMVSFGQEDIFVPQGMIAVDRAEKNCKGDATRAMVPSGGSWSLWPFTFRKPKTITTVRSPPEGTIPADLDTASRHKDLPENIDMKKSRSLKKKMPSLTPTSEELASLKLKEGSNVITFSFSTAMLGSQQVDARIYLWKWNTRVVISDVDGTITKSDVLGQFMPLVGVDWSQTGVAHLFSAIKENGYELLFLSARAISQAYLTRQFLFNLKQEGKVLPDGPVVISPDGLFPSLYREVIRRAPHEFKISCLEVIRALFPSDCNPFYAGFGNRDTDEISYLKVGIPKGKIFIINPKGEVAVNHRVDTKSYTSLHALVNGMFPPASSAELEDFNSWNYWKLPPSDIDD